MKVTIRRLVAFGGAAAMAAALTVPLATGTASAAATAPRGFNKAAAMKFIKSNDRLHIIKSAHVHASITGIPGYASSNWSGYVDGYMGDTTYSKVSAKWVEPKIKCKAGKGIQLAAFWVGIDGTNDGTVEQDGTIEECSGATYVGAADWWEMYPTNAVQIEFTITTGDHISSSVTIKGGRYVLAVTDATDPSASFTTTQSCGTTACDNSSAEWIGEAPCCSGSDVYNLAHWTPNWKVTAAKVTGSAGSGSISTYDGGTQEAFFEMFGDITGNPTADPTATNAPGTSFKDVWLGYN